MTIPTIDTFQSDPVLRDIAERREKFLMDVTSAQHSAIRRAKAEGETKKAIETLLRILTKRLGPMPENLSAKLKTLTDVSEIDRLTDIALDVSSLEDFKKNL